MKIDIDLAETPFVVFVDGMDGDLYDCFGAMGEGVKHAFLYGAKSVKIELWKKPEPKKVYVPKCDHSDGGDFCCMADDGHWFCPDCGQTQLIDGDMVYGKRNDDD